MNFGSVPQLINFLCDYFGVSKKAVYLLYLAIEIYLNLSAIVLFGIFVLYRFFQHFILAGMTNSLCPFDFCRNYILIHALSVNLGLKFSPLGS